MKTFKSIFIAVALLLGGASAQAQGLSDLLNGLGQSSSSNSGLSGTVGNLLSGIFQKSDLQLEDIVGEYVSDGPAVSFKSDNFLQKAGGIAGAAAIESKLQPYYEQYGLTGMPLVINSDGKFTLTVKGIPLSGTVEAKDGKGEFTFNIKALGAVKIGQFTAYITKSGKNIDLEFDAKKLKNIISSVGQISGMKMVSALTSILDSYEGAYMGFKMTYTGAADGGTSTETSTQATDSTATQQGSGLQNLFNILNTKKK
ncbi:MAG: DUF4923 family protein [Bacteroides sp.]|nr:DUF4923 family protein [Bacteroides sp.]MDE6423468.1 DUF4923 family protein [Muribaculaceae bacterium]